MEYRDAMDAVEVEADASIVKDGKTDGESRERLELRDKSLVGEFQSAALGGRSVVGAELEYSQAMGCPAGHMPLTIAGTGSGANLSGLFKIATDVTKDTTTETFGTGVARFAALISRSCSRRVSSWPAA